MLTLMLTRALLSHVRKVTQEYRYETPSGGAKAPVVIDGFMPPKRDDNGSDFPFVLIRPSEGKSDDEGSTATVQIIIGAFSQDYNGYTWAMNIAQHIRHSLLSLPDRMLEKRFRLALPLSWQLDDEQPWPTWLITLTTTWNYFTPETVLSNPETVYGYFDFAEEK